MVVFPNAKINLGLNILGKRSDGYHDLSTVFLPVPLYDALEGIIRNNSGKTSNDSRLPINVFHLQSGKEIRFSSSGLRIAGDPGSNLCLKACMLFDKRAGLPGNLDIHLHKVIPMGAGLGGGSSDGAFMLKLLNEISGFPLDTNTLLELASALGSDCAFFIHNKPSFAQGRGEILEPADLVLRDKFLVIVYPGIPVSTAKAFEGIALNLNPTNLKDAIAKPVSEWMNLFKNDFEKKIFVSYPEIARIKEEMLKQGASYTAMSGSGSAVYGIFESEVKFTSQFKDYRVYYLRTDAEDNS